MIRFLNYTHRSILCTILLSLMWWLALSHSTEAASLYITPETGVYTVGGTFQVQVVINTEGAPVNAAEGTLSFNPSQLQVISATRNASIFNLWTTEPSFSNSAGTITFGGGSPKGYTGSSGNVMTVLFRAQGAGEHSVRFSSASALAADGAGTNVLNTMRGGVYTVSSVEATPVPEYISPPNTPQAPIVRSSSHPDQDRWYREATVDLQWNIPEGVTAVRTLFDTSPSTIPTKVYDTPIDTLTITDVDEGESYFHIQFRNSEGWGRVTHYRVAVDHTPPARLVVNMPDDADLSSPVQRLHVSAEESISSILTYKVSIDGKEPIEIYDEEGDGVIVLPSLEPGYHSLIIEAFDQAGNSVVEAFHFTIISFDKPIFTEYPTQINEEVIPVIQGVTRPDASVAITVKKVGTGDAVPREYTLTSDGDGVFTFIPEERFVKGIYEIHAVATDDTGARSEPSDTIKIAVQPPGYIVIGSMLVNALSVIVPLVALFILLLLMVTFFIRKLRLITKSVEKETSEALQILKNEFSSLREELNNRATELKKSRKNNTLTKNEEALVLHLHTALDVSEKKVSKEISDVDDILD